MIERADHSRIEVAESIRAVLAEAYRVEAAVIGLAEADFPPLRRTADDVTGCRGVFYLAMDSGVPVGVIEVEPQREPGDAAVVASLGVVPAAHRRGFGRALVTFVLARHAGDLLVSTAAENTPAILLYESLGFAAHRRYRSADGLPLLELKRAGTG